MDITIRVVKAELSDIEGYFGMTDVFANVHWQAADGRRWQIARTPTAWMSGPCPEWEYDCPRQPYATTGGADADDVSRKRSIDDFCLRTSGCRVSVEVLQERFGGFGEPHSSGSATVEADDLLEGVLDGLRYWASGPEIALELRRGEKRCGTVTVRASLRRSDSTEAARWGWREEASSSARGGRIDEARAAVEHKRWSADGAQVSSDCTTSLGGTRRESDATDMSSAASSASDSDADELDGIPELARRLRATTARCPTGGVMSMFGLGAKEDYFLAVHGVSGSGVEDFGPFVQAFAQAAIDKRGGSSAGIVLSWWRCEASWEDREPPVGGIPVDGILGVLVGENSPRRGRGSPKARETSVTVTFIMEDKAKASSELEFLFASAEVAEDWAADLSALVGHVSRKLERSRRA